MKAYAERFFCQYHNRNVNYSSDLCRLDPQNKDKDTKRTESISTSLNIVELTNPTDFFPKFALIDHVELRGHIYAINGIIHYTTPVPPIRLLSLYVLLPPPPFSFEYCLRFKVEICLDIEYSCFHSRRLAK